MHLSSDTPFRPSSVGPSARPRAAWLRGMAWRVGLGLGLAGAFAGAALAQGVDCARLQQQIAGGGRSGGGQKASAELARSVAYARQIGCDRQQFLFFGGAPPQQCGGLNARISQLQASLAQGGGNRDELVARFNAYCRGGQQSAGLQPPPRQRGFFESLFGGGEEQRQAPPAAIPQAVPRDSADEDGGDGVSGARGGSQAVCVRTCDGGFFPMNMSSRHGGDTLNELCAALCPNTPVAVYTRNPNSEIKTAVSLDGTPYMELPNALKFQKSFDSACTCRPANKTWAEALAGAEGILGNQRKGDILVTPEKAAEMSRPKLDAKARASLLNAPAPSAALGTAADVRSPTGQADDVTGPDGVTRRVRTVGPKL